MSPYEQGRIHGQWTRETLQSIGWRSAREFLEHLEKCHQEDVASLANTPKERQALAAEQLEYLEGVISAERESLRSIIAEEDSQQ